MPHFKNNRLFIFTKLWIDPRLFTLFLEISKERTSGISAPQAGFGHFTVRAHSQAITVAS
jgi:hypothetical protein